jgi:ectoine hydrolase
VPAESLRFDLAEYMNRLHLTRMAMDASGVDVLIVTDPSNMYWLTGYDGWSFYVPQCIVISQGEAPLWFGRQMDTNGAKRTVYMEDSCLNWYEDHYVQSDDRHPMSVLARLIQDKGWSKSSIGVEKDNVYFTAKGFEVLTAALPNATFKDTTRLVKWQRIIKSPKEIEYMRAGGKIVSAMHERISEVLRPGSKQSDVVAEIYHTGTKGVGDLWGDYPAGAPQIGAGADASAPHLTWTDRKLEVGESIFFELAGVYKRYHVPLSRTYHIGKPVQKFVEAEKAIIEGMEVGLQNSVVGNTCEDVAKAYYAVVEKHGLSKPSRAGYSVGVAYPPDWGEHTASIRLGDKTVLQPGMTFHFMSGLWMGDWGIEITESILITDSGPECLSTIPRRLFTIE